MDIDPASVVSVDEVLATTRAVRRRLDLERPVDNHILLGVGARVLGGRRTHTARRLAAHTSTIRLATGIVQLGGAAVNREPSTTPRSQGNEP